MRYFKSFSLFFGDKEIFEKIGNDKLVSFWISIEDDRMRAGMIYKGSEEGVYHTVIMDNEKIWCSCAGYQFRKRCKHIEWARNDVSKVLNMMSLLSIMGKGGDKK